MNKPWRTESYHSNIFVIYVMSTLHCSGKCPKILRQFEYLTFLEEGKLFSLNFRSKKLLNLSQIRRMSWAWKVCSLEDFNLNFQYRGDSQLLLRLQPGPGTALHHGDLQRPPAQPRVQPGLQLLQDHPQLQQEDDVTQPTGPLISGTDIAQVYILFFTGNFGKI